MSARGFLLHPTYRIRGARAVVQLFGRLEDGRPFLAEDDRFRPYLFVRRADAERARAAGGGVGETDLTDLGGAAVVRVEARTPADLSELRSGLARAGVEALEADLRFPYRYLIDHELRSGLAIEGAEIAAANGLVVFRNPALGPARVAPRLATLSLDIETTPSADRILAVALFGAGAEEVLLLARQAVAGARSYPDERALLEALIGRIRELDPDVIVGWNVVDFDLRVIARRCRALGLRCALGRTDEEIGFERDPGFTRQGRASVPGRVVLDGIGVVREALRLPDYRLETAARAVLGRGKRIDKTAPDPAAEIERLYREDLPALVAYNLEDARLVAEILEREGLLALTVERSQLTGMPLDRVSASIASFDRLYLPDLRRAGVVAPSAGSAERGARVHGGALLESVPGLFRNVAVFDFKSLYPSLIRTFHLDPLAHARAGPDAIVAPNGARFSRTEAILPRLIEELMERREAAKRRGDRHADQAIKIMMNAFFGVLGTPACRFFDPEIANAITLFGQQTLRWTRDLLEAAGRRVLYGDTDSVFVELETREPGTAARDEAEKLRARVEAGIAERIRGEYGVEPALALELEHVLERFFLPRVRGGRGGSKKRYAGLCDGRLLVVGLEAVRRDWPEVARRLQLGMLERVLSDRDPAPFAAEVVARLRAGDLDHELVYAKRLRKGALESYTATTPPHVEAARRAGWSAAGEAGGAEAGRAGVIRYVITERGPEPVGRDGRLPEDVDREHYVEKVVRPIADAILRECGTSLAAALGEPRQLRLL